MFPDGGTLQHPISFNDKETYYFFSIIFYVLLAILGIGLRFAIHV